MDFREWFLLAESLLDKYADLIQRFLQQVGDLVNLDDPMYANCGEVSARLAKFLIKHGIPAKVLCAYTYTGELGDDANPTYSACPRNSDGSCGFYHMVTQVPDAIIDLTGRQFGRQYRGPRVLTLQDFMQHWKTNQEVPDYFWPAD